MATWPRDSGVTSVPGDPAWTPGALLPWHVSRTHMGGDDACCAARELRWLFDEFADLARRVDERPQDWSSGDVVSAMRAAFFAAQYALGCEGRAS